MNFIKVRDVVIGEGRPKICVPVVGKTVSEIVEQAKSFEGVPYDMVEWRLDHFEGACDWNRIEEVLPVIREIVGNAPLLVTFRTAEEGGECSIGVQDYAELLAKVAASGDADLLDMELNMLEQMPEMVAAVHLAGGVIVGSCHDFEKTPSKDEIIANLCRMQDLGCDIVKMATMPNCKRDVITLLAATEEMCTDHAKVPVVSMSMTGLGVVSRLVGESFGSAITFGCFGKASAPGQMDAPTLDGVLEAIHKAL